MSWRSTGWIPLVYLMLTTSHKRHGRHTAWLNCRYVNVFLIYLFTPQQQRACIHHTPPANRHVNLFIFPHLFFAPFFIVVMLFISFFCCAFFAFKMLLLLLLLYSLEKHIFLLAPSTPLKSFHPSTDPYNSSLLYRSILFF